MWKKESSSRKAVCTLCGKEAYTIAEMTDHYKDHPDIKVIDGVNEAEVMEFLLNGERE